MDGICAEDTKRLDLRSGRTVWELEPNPPSRTVTLERSRTADVIVVGAGITGSFLAERLTREGRSVLLLDRHEPRTASTAASTALLQWEIDASMLELEDRLGFERASAIYRRSFEGVAMIAALARNGAAFVPRETLFFAGTDLDAADLAEEHRLRSLAGLPGALLDTPALAGLGFDRAAAIRTSGAAEANPVALAHLALEMAITRGATVASPVMATGYDCGFERVTVTTGTGIEITGNAVVLANGYEMPPFVPARAHSIHSTWALATEPQDPAVLWPGHALLWEASSPYFYARTTPENRIVIGGGDEPLTDAGRRDALLPTKAVELLATLQRLLPQARTGVDAAWAGFFGETEDGLPLIGPVPGLPRCYAAFGYGGNGITFSAIAADLIATALRGGRDAMLEAFAIDR